MEVVAALQQSLASSPDLLQEIILILGDGPLEASRDTCKKNVGMGIFFLT